MPWQHRQKRSAKAGTVIVILMVLVIGVSMLLWLVTVLDIRLGADSAG